MGVAQTTNYFINVWEWHKRPIILLMYGSGTKGHSFILMHGMTQTFFTNAW